MDDFYLLMLLSSAVVNAIIAVRKDGDFDNAERCGMLVSSVLACAGVAGVALSITAR